MAEKLIYILFQIPGLTIILAAIILNVMGKCSLRVRRSMTAMLVVVAISMLSYAQFFNQSLGVSLPVKLLQPKNVRTPSQR